MTKRDLFLIVIKLFGLYIAMKILFNFVSIGPSIGFHSGNFVHIALAAGFTLFYVGLCMVFLFNGKHIVKWLKLDQGFDSPTIDGNIFTEATIVKLASLIIGGFLVINSLEALVSKSLYLFYLERWEGKLAVMDKFHIFSNLIQLMVGSFLVTRYRYIQRLLLKKED